MNKICICVVILLASVAAIAHPGVGIVMDSKGNVFYTDLKHIWKISPQGTISVAVRNVHTHEIYMDENDNLFGEHLWYEGEATNKWGHYVWRLSAGGHLEKIVSPTEGFRSNYSFVQDQRDHMYLVNKIGKCQYIMRKGPDNTSRKFTEQCFEDIRWMTISPDGNLYLIDRHDLKKITQDGTVETLAANLNERKLTQLTVSDQHMVMGVWTDQKENAYVAIYGARQVKRVSPNKTISVVAETSIGWSPTGGLVAPNGDYWLLECSLSNEVRVEKISPDGTRIIYSSYE